MSMTLQGGKWVEMLEMRWLHLPLERDAHYQIQNLDLRESDIDAVGFSSFARRVMLHNPKGLPLFFVLRKSFTDSCPIHWAVRGIGKRTW